MSRPRIRTGPAFNSFGNAKWTGYIDVADPNVKLRYVQSTFTVPTVTCTSSGSEASFWVGLDGYGNSTVEQAGLSTNCHGGQPVYQDWYEMYPRGTDYEHYVNAGDSITAAVYYNSGNGDYDLSVTDNTNSAASFDVAAVCPSGSTCENTTAEAVLEADNGTNLSDFTPVFFTDCGVTSRDGTHGAFQDAYLWDTTYQIMTNSSGNPLASLTATWDSGEDFEITYDRSS